MTTSVFCYISRHASFDTGWGEESCLQSPTEQGYTEVKGKQDKWSGGDEPVFSSSLALLRFSIMLVMDFMVPFLQDVSCEAAMAIGLADILKFPPTKNWRPMVAVEAGM